MDVAGLPPDLIGRLQHARHDLITKSSNVRAFVLEGVSN
jgi:hypothetical protein